MFTGIITDVGRVRSAKGADGIRLEIDTTYETGGIELGASIACSGVCLTVVDKGEGWFAVDVSPETLRCTAIREWQAGTGLNLERALCIGDELGGHIVTGHVDGVGETMRITAENGHHLFEFSVPAEIAGFVAPKGSISVNGVSLTVNAVTDDADGTRFGVNIIPHTSDHTTFCKMTAGDKVHLEIDVLARYVARLDQTR